MNDLSIDSIDVGMIKCCNQATQLFHDAELLFENKRFTTAFALYQLASEESSKIKILLRLVLEKRSGIILMDADRGKYFQKLFYSHLEKTKLGIITDQNLNELSKRLDIPKFRDENQILEELKNPKQPDLLKQDGIYVSHKEGIFMSPSEIIGEKECIELREIVFSRLSSQKATMEDYLQYTEFFVDRFIEETKREYQENQSKTSDKK